MHTSYPEVSSYTLKVRHLISEVDCIYPYENKYRAISEIADDSCRRYDSVFFFFSLFFFFFSYFSFFFCFFFFFNAKQRNAIEGSPSQLSVMQISRYVQSIDHILLCISLLHVFKDVGVL